MIPRHLALTLLVAASGALVTLATTGTVMLYAWWVVAPGSCLVAVLLGVRRHRPSPLHPWFVLAGALALIWVGWMVSAGVGAGVLTGRTATTAMVLRDGLYVVAYPGLGIAGLLIVRCRTGGRDRDNLIDAAIVMAALSIVLGAWLFGGGEVAQSGGTLEKGWVTSAPLVLAAVVSASVRLLFADGYRLPAAWLMLASSTSALLGNLWTSQLIRDGAPTQVAGVDVLWVLAFVALASAAHHPSMAELTEPVSDERLTTGLPIDRLVIITAALLATPFAQLRLSAEGLEERAVAIAGVVLAGLVIWRVVRLLGERDQARAALGAAAARDATIATIGRWALDDREVEELLADTQALLSAELPDVTCRIEPADPADDQDPVRHDPLLSDAPVSYDIDDGSSVVARLLLIAPVERSPVPGEAAFLEGVAALLSSALRRRSAEERLRHDALHDPLTGLANRALAVDRIEARLRGRERRPVAVAFLDLDGFKSVNDTLGHAAGDRVLCEVAARLAAVVRADDTVARFAGDEFVVIVDGGDRAALRRLVDRLREAATLPAADGTDGVTASIGVAIGGGEDDAETLLRRADAAMYRAKHRSPGTAVWWDGPDRDRALT